jgi:hypothetical protein
MEPTQCSETSAFNTQTPGKYPEDSLSLQQHGESLKTRVIKLFGPNYLIKGSVRYLFWPWGAVKKVAEALGGAVEREILGTAGQSHRTVGCSSCIKVVGN